MDIYTKHFGLRERPFSLVPDPDFLFWGPSHKRAFSILEYGVLTRAPITLITGEVGAGKTTLLHELLRSLEDDVIVGLLANTQGDRAEILRWAMMALGQQADASETYVDLFARFQSFLIDQYAEGRRVLLVFDEAQNLSREALEELRMFTNINSNKDELLQIVLVGQPELRDRIMQPDLTQFAQRVAANFHLSAMGPDAVRDYIRARLSTAGAEGEIFSDEACRVVAEQTGGVPRLVNQLCDLSMVYAYSDGETTVAGDTVRQVVEDGMFFRGARPEPLRLVNPATRAT